MTWVKLIALQASILAVYADKEAVEDQIIQIGSSIKGHYNISSVSIQTWNKVQITFHTFLGFSRLHRNLMFDKEDFWWKYLRLGILTTKIE